MRRVSKGYTGVDIPLFPTMLTAPESSPSRITSSPSLSPQTHPSTSQQPPTPPFMQTIHDAEEPATMPYDLSQPRKVEDLKNALQQTKLTYDAAYTKLIPRVKKLEHKMKELHGFKRMLRLRGGLVLILRLLEQEEPTELVEDPGSGEKGEKEISTAEKGCRKEKGKAIIKDDESAQNEDKKQLEQERLGHEEAIRLHEQINEEKRQRIAKDAEIAKQLQEEIDITSREDNMQSHFKGMSYEDIRPIFERPPAKRQKVGEVSGSVEEQFAGKENEVSEEDLKKLLVIVPVEEVYIKEKGHDIFMLVEKGYPLIRALMTVMLVNKLQVDESLEMANELKENILSGRKIKT
ncbi:hypothetical protein Tco_0867629 [Tanacetum coccineum]